MHWWILTAGDRVLAPQDPKNFRVTQPCSSLLSWATRDSSCSSSSTIRPRASPLIHGTSCTPSTPLSTRRTFNYDRLPAALERAEARMASCWTYCVRTIIWRTYVLDRLSGRTAKLINRPSSLKFKHFLFGQVQISNLAMGYQLMDGGKLTCTLPYVRPYNAPWLLRVGGEGVAVGGLSVWEAYGGRLKPVWPWTCMHRSYTPIRALSSA
jgi:hypothetical protein